MPHSITKPTRVGLTIFPHKTGFSFWSNGGHANIAHLWTLFRQVENVEPILINGGDGEPPTDSTMPPEIRTMQWAKLPDVIDSLDVLIEAGAQVSADDVARVRARGGKAITLKFGNTLVIDGERAIHDKQAGAIYNGARFNEVWTTAQHAPTCASLWEVMYRCPVRVLPHVWEPTFVEAMCRELEALGIDWRYKPGREKKRIVIAEPNIQFFKTCFLPMIVAEVAFRRRPELFEAVYVLNADHLKTRLVFRTFVEALSVATTKADDGHNVMGFESRFRIPWFLAEKGDVVLSNTWIDTPNYLHYDVLHLGYPLVHNITNLPGYHYPTFDATWGSTSLLRAMSEHDANRETYEATARSYLRTVRATAPENVEAHARALAEVIAS